MRNKNEQHPLFLKYTRQWLHEQTGFTKGYLCRVASGKVNLSRSFIERACFGLNQSEDELFLPLSVRVHRWLKKNNLSLRQAGAKVGLSRQTIKEIRDGHQPNPENLKKLEKAFGGR